MKIYTGSGDGGRTSLFSGERVAKDHVRVQAYGDMDELNSLLGALISVLGGKTRRFRDPLERIQADLFSAGARLASTATAPEALPPDLEWPSRSAELERSIDALQSGLPPLDAFILPGGHPASASAHVARAVCRRVERRVVTLAAGLPSRGSAGGMEGLLVFLNRLSDYLFVLARAINHIEGIPERTWQG